MDYSKITENQTIIELLKERESIEAKIKEIDDEALISYELEKIMEDDSMPKIEDSEEIDTLDNYHYQNGFLAGIIHAKRWIPIEEGLPNASSDNDYEFSDLILTKDKLDVIRLERYDFRFSGFTGRRYSLTENEIIDGQVTHYRYID